MKNGQRIGPAVEHTSEQHMSLVPDSISEGDIIDGQPRSKYDIDSSGEVQVDIREHFWYFQYSYVHFGLSTTPVFPRLL